MAQALIALTGQRQGSRRDGVPARAGLRRHPAPPGRASLAAALLLTAAASPAATTPAPGSSAAAPTAVYGPYNADFISGGSALAKPLSGFKGTATVAAGVAFSLSGWVHAQECPGHRCLLFGIGSRGGSGIFLGLKDSRLALWVTGAPVVASTAPLGAGTWRFIVATFDGSTVRLYLDGTQVASQAAHTPAVRPILQLAPRRFLAADDGPFAGRLADVLVTRAALGAPEIRAAAHRPPAFDLINFEAGSPSWPVQTRQMVGQSAPQDAWTLPKSRAPFSAPVAAPVSNEPALRQLDANTYLVGRWRLRPAPEVAASPEKIAAAGFDASAWYPAVVPGTVLTTLIARGVYPDPAFGLNNLAIPESLNKQDYWYRTTFVAPPLAPGQHARLDFNGINYSARIWVNGHFAGAMRGAFARGRLDVTGLLHPGQPSVIAVRVSPPPDPGIPHEKSISAGPGNNGGMLALDGPTFIATEGWDWIPAVRDRNTGIWQDVRLHVTGEVEIGDLQVITTLPDPHSTATAEVEIDVPLTSHLDRPVTAQLRAAFDDVAVVKPVTLAPGTTRVVLDPAEFPALRISHPRLWWPNGYGEPTLHTLRTTVAVAGHESDRRVTRFGMRQVTYELSLLDSHGHLRRVEINPSLARARGERLVDTSHAAIRRLTAEHFGTWAPTLRPGAERSPAVQPLKDDPLAPNLVIRVNGVRIAVRGGSWGMDDFLKRVSRQRLEPYFRLERQAHLNTIRNWLGQSTEENFFSLADEYGLMVIDELWISTQNFQLEPEDVPLFLANAADVIRRFRNHPSIIFWNGRNEGVPPPLINVGLARLVDTLDGTRYYSPASLAINLALGGPYAYRPPQFYFNYWGNGFTMEVGLPSFPTLEAFKAMMAPEDWWPIGDTWAYHDWHASGNGDTRPFMAAMSKRYGAPTSLEDFARKAQLMNYESHRAVFEGFNAGLWTRNSGRLLWMSQPAWPSTVWQILSWDYDTHASYYGVKSAAEPVHVQLNLPDWQIAVINNTQQALHGLRLRAAIHRLDGKTITRVHARLDAAANAVTAGPTLELGPLLEQDRALLITLSLSDSHGKLLSRNFYWQTRDDADGRLLVGMPAQRVSLSVSRLSQTSESHVHIRVRNEGSIPVLAVKLTLLNADGKRILPAYYSDNYISLLPHESRDIEIDFPGAPHGACAVRGWNVVPGRVVF